MDTRQSRAWSLGPQAGPSHNQNTAHSTRTAPRRSTDPDARQAHVPSPYEPTSNHIPRQAGDTYQSAISPASESYRENGFSVNRDLPPPSFASSQTSPISPISAGLMPSASRLSSNDGSSFASWERKAGDRHSTSEGRYVSLAVPYVNTAPSTRPTLGDRPLQATGVVNGIPKHTRTSTPIIEIPSQKSGKRTTLNLLNPVNLLMRRRSGIPPAAAADASNTKTLTVPPMTLPEDYDPRIRGKVVHDFSAPRPRRATSQQNIQGWQGQAGPTPEPAPKGGSLRESTVDDRPSSSGNAQRASQHSAVFREHLDDDTNDKHRQSAIHAEALANKDFLKRLSQNQTEYDPATLPSFSPASQHRDFQQFRRSIGDWQARVSEPSSVSSRSEVSALSGSPIDQRRSHYSVVSSDPSSKDRSSNQRALEEYSKPTEQVPTSPPQKASTTPAQSPDPDKASENGLPKHLKSNASRFSFQLTGNDNVIEEKLLEERAKRQRAAADAKREAIQDEDEDYFDEDAMYDADELEGLNDASDDFEGFEQYNNNINIDPIQSLPVENIIQAPAQPTLQEGFQYQANPNIQRFLDYQRAHANSDAANLDHENPAQMSSMNDAATQPRDLASGGRSDSHQGFPEQLLPPQVKPDTEYRLSRASHDFDDDLYFDDGTINAEVSYTEDDDIDEDELFASDDDEAQIAKGRAFAATVTMPQHDANDPMPTEAQPQVEGLEAQTQVQQLSQQPPAMPPSPHAPGGLAAYHNALAEAAHKAAADGRFSRAASTATSASKYSQRSASSRFSSKVDRQTVTSPPAQHPQKLPRDSYSGFDFGFNNATTDSTNTPLSASFPVNALTTGEDDLNYGDDFDGFDDDEAVIAEANAEALASDDEGFYGREFGFYAKARPGSGEVDYVNGGYFGTPGESTIERKYSVKEPNLTPITERSEFSTRNSLIGGPFTPAMATPAFAAQLARMSPLALAHMQEDDMTLEQMLKLRNLTFNGTDGTGRSGSISSMSSAAGYTSGLPLSHRGSWTIAATGAQFPIKGGSPMALQHSADGGNRSSIRMSRSQSETMYTDPMSTQSPIADSPISTQSARVYPWHATLPADLDSTPRKSVAEPNSPHTPPTAVKNPQRPFRGHARTGSGGGDSVTYTKERNDDGTERWILERRRTSEAGLVELVGREVVEGGRI
ncbi:hypothetical protein K461DRAFT_264592 [Myriangium duriaei CBS 260.36]|uniref:AGC-kinase C-terminal domain-containing protein n=1 Tax=Myriangium duriaei CBS 260.36 TaxID=1168546 RepID=A0A9P4J9D1_9PEZI|nr:hypothetical protein K461DRAFT_264592 [Myriangium duriaei CBS 260.36]